MKFKWDFNILFICGCVAIICGVLLNVYFSPSCNCGGSKCNCNGSGGSKCNCNGYGFGSRIY